MISKAKILRFLMILCLVSAVCVPAASGSDGDDEMEVGSGGFWPWDKEKKKPRITITHNNQTVQYDGDRMAGLTISTDHNETTITIYEKDGGVQVIKPPTKAQK